jgi:hypothetical protein
VTSSILNLNGYQVQSPNDEINFDKNHLKKESQNFEVKPISNTINDENLLKFNNFGLINKSEINNNLNDNFNIKKIFYLSCIGTLGIWLREDHLFVTMALIVLAIPSFISNDKYFK